MKLLFRSKSDGLILKPIQTQAARVHLQHVESGLVWWGPNAKLPQLYTIHAHDIEPGDVLRDTRDGQLQVVERASQHGLRFKSGKSMTYFGLIHYERVGRKYRLREHDGSMKAIDPRSVILK
nr:MAG TPA: hypothetical protein [Caudoviricetes sp.]